MSELTAQELNEIREERNLTHQQLEALQRAVRKYHTHASKEEILNTFRRFGYNCNLFETDLQKRFEQKKEKPVKISYDLLPNGRVENFEVQEVDE